MKGLACGRCGDFRALHRYGWTDCSCGNVRGRWTDPVRGIAEYDSQNRETAWGIGMNNDFYVPAIQGKTAMYEDARALHDKATHAPHHIFDKSRASCWAVIFKPGSTNDTSWYQPKEELP